MRDETGRVYENGKIGILESVREAVEVGRRAETPVEISHLKIAAPTNTVEVPQVLEIIERARREGLDLHADQYPYDAGSTLITHLIPNRFKTSDGVREEFKTERGKKEIREAIEKTFAYVGPEKTLISWYPGKEELEGKTIRQIADAAKKTADCYVEMVTGEKCPMGIFFLMDAEKVKAIMPHNYIITASDGWTVPKDMTKPHPRVYGTFPRKLRTFVIDEKLMDLPAAIRSMTSLPAEKFGLKDRGRIAKGYCADVAVIDLKTIRDHATYLKPHQYSDGVRYLLVKGVLSIENGQATGDRAGAALRRG